MTTSSLQPVNQAVAYPEVTDQALDVQPGNVSHADSSADIFAGMSQNPVILTDTSQKAAVIQNAIPDLRSISPVVTSTRPMTESSESELPDEKDSRIDKLNKVAGKEVSIFSDELMEISAKHCLLTTSTKDLTSERHQLDDELKSIGISILENEEEQQRLAQIEEFEKADALSVILDTLRRRSKIVEDRIAQVIDVLASTQVEMSQIYSQRASTLSRMLERFKNLVMEQQVEREKLEKKRDLYIESTDSRLRIEEQRVALEKSHVEKENASVQEDKKVIEDAISVQLTDVSGTRVEYESRLLSVSAEIRELETRLAAKREEERELQTEIETLDVRVREVRKKYDRQLIRLEDRQVVLEKSKTECAQEERALAEERSMYEREVSEQTKVIDHIGKWIKAVNVEDIVLTKIKNALSEQDSVDATVMSEATPTTNLTELRAKCSEMNSLIQQSLNEKDALELHIGHLQEEESDLNERLPKLEIEKKAHAAARRFKEAGVVAKDIKDITARAEEIKSEIQTTQEKISANLDSFSLSQKAYNEELSKLLEAEKESELRNFTAIFSRAKRLNRVKLTIQRKLLPFSFDDVEGSGHQSPVLNDGASIAVHYMIRENSMRLLDSELDGLVNEITILGAKFGLETDLGDDTEDDAVDEAIDVATMEAINICDPADVAEVESGADPIVKYDNIGELNGEPTTSDDDTDTNIDTNIDGESNNAPEDTSTDATLSRVAVDSELKDLEQRVNLLTESIEKATEEENFEAAAELDEKLIEVNNRIEYLRGVEFQ